MSGLRVSNLRGVAGSAPTFPDGVVVTGVSTATTFDGNLTGNVTGNVVGNVTGDVTGNITGTTGSFSGNVSVGGTLTYNDVTNVDSIGVVTARGGIKVGAGQSISAVSGIITYYGDGSQLQGVESGVSNFVASGTLSNGQTVIVNTDGTVSGVSTSSVTESLGSIVNFEPGGGSEFISGVDIGNGRVVFAYSDIYNSRHGTAVVGTINGSTITFGTPVVFHAFRTNYTSVAYDSANDRVVICFSDGNQGSSSSGNGKARVVQVTGNSFGTFGTLTQFHGGNTSYNKANYDSVSGKIVISFLDATPNHGKAVVGEITSGTTNITFGSDTTFNGSNTALNVTSTFDVKKNRLLVVFRNNSQSTRSYAVVGQISGTSISFGTIQKFTNNTMNEVVAVYNPDANSGGGSSLIAYRDQSAGNIGRCLGAQIDPSNNSITFGQILPFHDAECIYIGLGYDPNAKRYIVTYRDTADSNKMKVDIGYEQSPGANNGYFRDYIGTGNALQINPTHTYYSSFPVYNAQDKNVVLGLDDDGVVYTPPSVGTNLTATNYIGIAGEAISNGATGKVTIFGGTNSGQTGLTTAQTYYVQTDGSLSTTAGDPSVVAGTSISSTKIIVKG